MNINSLSKPVAIELHNHHVYLPVRAGGRHWWFLLDTGAGASLMSMRAARALAVPLGPPFTARGAGDATVTGAVFAPPFAATVAGDPAPVTLVGALPLDDVERHEGRAIDGILGYDFIARHVIEIDYAGRTLTAHDPRAFEYNGHGISLPITLKHNHPHVEASLEVERGAWISGDFVIDIGSRLHVALTRPFTARHDLLRRLGPTVPSDLGRGVGGGAGSQAGHARSLRVGNWIHELPTVAMFGDGAGVFTTGAYFEGNIGGAILSQYRVIIDYSRNRIVVE